MEAAEGSSNAGIGVYLNNGTVGGKLSWVVGATPMTTRMYMMLIFVDLNDDNNLDILAGTHARGIKVWFGNGGAGGSLQWIERVNGLPTNGAYTGIAAGDMNNDDKMDIVSCDYQGGLEIHLWTGDGQGNWTNQDSSFSTGTETTLGVVLGDVDKDGNMDIIYGRRNNAIKCLLGNGGGTSGTSFSWTDANTGLSTTSRYSMVDLADVDIDGDLDLLAASDGRGLELYLGNGGQGGTQNWTLASVGLPTGKFYGAKFGDFNHDNVLDVVGSLLANRNEGGIRAYKGSVYGASFPTARAVWENGSSNRTMALVDDSVLLNGTVSYDAEDAPDGDLTGTALVYDWNLTAAPPTSTLTEANLTPDDASAKPAFIPDVPGNFTFTLAVSDSDLHWSLGEAILELEAFKPNIHPVSIAGNDQTVEIGTEVDLDGSSSYDLDGQIVNWSWVAVPGNPASVTLWGANTSMANFTAPLVTGIYSFSLVVLDDNDTWSLEDLVNVTVELPPNVLPIADAGVDHAITLGGTIELNGSGSHDPDGGTIVVWDWNCTSHPSLVITDGDAMVAAVTPNEAGTYNFTLTVRDDRGGWSVEDNVAVLVLAPYDNLPPVALISGNPLVEMTVNGTLAIDSNGSYDEDGVIVEYLWNYTPLNNASLVGQNTSFIRLTAIESGEIQLTLAVRDDNGSWSLQEAMVTILVLAPPPPPPPPPPNKPPVAVIDGPVGPVVSGAPIPLNAEGSYDTDGVLLDYGWRCPSHPSVEIEGLNTTFAGFDADEAGSYLITLQVMDDNGTWSDIASFTVLVIEQNLPPVVEIRLPSSTELNLSETLHVEWTVNDPNGDDLTFTVSIFNGSALISDKVGIDGQARSMDFLLERPVVFDGMELTIIVAAFEVGTADLLNDTDTGGPYVVVGVGPREDPPPEPEPDDDEETVSSISVLTIALIMFAIIVALTVTLVLWGRLAAGNSPMIPPTEPLTSGPGQASLPTSCPDCGDPLSSDNAFGRPYCPSCDKYL